LKGNGFCHRNELIGASAKGTPKNFAIFELSLIFQINVCSLTKTVGFFSQPLIVMIKKKENNSFLKNDSI
jgi:hypothetical protein